MPLAPRNNRIKRITPNSNQYGNGRSKPNEIKQHNSTINEQHQNNISYCPSNSEQQTNTNLPGEINQINAAFLDNRGSQIPNKTALH